MTNMKKVLCMFIALTLVFSVCAQALAAESYSKEAEALLASVLQRIGDTSQYPDFSVQSFENDSEKSYHFNWVLDDDDNYKSLHVSVTYDGIITDYSSYDYEREYGEFDAPIAESIDEKALDLVNLLNPSLKGKLTLEREKDVYGLRNSTSVEYSIKHIENGVPVCNDGGRISVSLDGGVIYNFHLNYTENAVYPEVSQAISKNAAQTAFAEKIGMELVYKSYYDYKKKEHLIYPAYIINDSTIYINAITSEPETFVLFDVYNYKTEESMAMADTGRGTSRQKFSEAELAELDAMKGLIPREEAEKKILSNKILKLSSSYKITDFECYKEEDADYIYSFSLSDGEKHAYVMMNAVNGEVLSFFKFNEKNEGREFSLSAQRAQNAADAAVKSLAPVKGGEYKLKTAENNTFVYNRYVNEIRVENDNIEIELDSSYNVNSYRISYTNKDFPTAENALSNDEICKKLFEIYDYTLAYIITKDDDSQTEGTALVYMLENSYPVLNPETGRELNYDGTEKSDKTLLSDYTDISGHYCEYTANALKNYNIGFAGGSFFPDKSLLQKEFIAMLVSAFSYTNAVIYDDLDYTDIYRQAKNMGIIKAEEVVMDSLITRFDAVKLLARAMDLEKIAELDEIFNCPFYDVADGKGYVSLLWGLKVVNGTSENAFSPDQNMVRGQAAVILYNAMAARSKLNN